MITCPKCSAQNDPSNHYCDQCGFRLEGVADSPPPAIAAAPVATAPSPTAPTIHCPSCGAEVVAGEAYCEVCGASLQPVEAPALANDLPTVIAPPAGGTNAMSETATNPNDMPTAATPTVAPTPEPSAAAPATPAPAPAHAPSQSVPSQQEYDAEKQRLEDVIATHEKLIAQMEQLQSTFGANTPSAIVDGLKQARETKSKAESDLQALPPPKPPVDPAEVARLEEQITTQNRLITQMEQLQSTFGAATPPAIIAGLAQARETKAKVESDLQALTNGTTPAPLQSQVPTKTDIAPVSGPATPPSNPVVPSAVGPALGRPSAEDQTLPPPALTPVPPPPPAVPAPIPQGPRLVFADGGKDVPLPLDKVEIIVGREDPISQIFPEIDLTPFGGETGGVSRQHARITQNNGQWLLTDLNSTNYTRIDGVKIDPQVPVTMRDGARVQFGRISAVFHV